MATVRDIFPEFSDELVRLVQSSARPELADQIPSLPVVDRCGCGQSNCALFYTAPRPSGAYGPGHSNVLLDPKKGLIVLDVVEGRVVAVEVLDRPDVKRRLDAGLS
jgi:hypothetical protein